MSNMDFQRCNECNKVLDMTCSCSPDNYIVQLPVSDHVSKSELREWCESYLVAIGHKKCNAYTIREATVIYDILERFCKGER